MLLSIRQTCNRCMAYRVTKSTSTQMEVYFPNRQDGAVGGFGIWIPKPSVDQAEHDKIVQGTGNLMIWEVWKEGTAMWAPMYGLWFSSARTELMGLIIRISVDDPQIDHLRTILTLNMVTEVLILS